MVGIERKRSLRKIKISMLVFLDILATTHGILLEARA